MFNQDEEEDDIENQISMNNIILHKNRTELKVVKQRQDTQGFIETNIELFHIPREPSVTTVTSSASSSSIFRSICLSIEDLKTGCSYEDERDCWRFHNVLFKCVLLYGRVTIKNESTRNKKSFYTISVDDETESIDGFLNKCTQQEANKNKQYMVVKRSELERRKDTGINLRGIFYGTSSVECQSLLSNLRDLQEMIRRNFTATEKQFPLGVLGENCLVFASPFKNTYHESTRLRVIDLVKCGSLELAWKRNLNRLYSEWYYKQ